MRKTLIWALAPLALAGCGVLPPRYHPPGEAVVGREPMIRSGPAVRGEKTLREVTLVRLAVVPQGVAISVAGSASQPGYTDLRLRPVQYFQEPADGIYDLYLVGKPPRRGGGDLTAVSFTWTWSPTPGRVKGVRIHSEMNTVTAMLPAAG